jgi:N-methylhydantoinase A
MGLLVADARNDYVRTSLMDTASAESERVNPIFDQLESEARQWLAREGFEEADQRLSRTVDMRYVGQNFELSVEVPPRRLNPGDMEELISRFYVEHEKNYGHYTPGEPTQLVNFRVIARGVIPKLDMTRGYENEKEPPSALLSHRSVCFDEGAPLLTPVYDRFKLHPGQHITGPAVIEQMDSTTLIFPGDLAEIDPIRNIRITLKEKSR